MACRGRILVTGAAGFIGGHVARALAARGDAVLGLLGPADAEPPGAPPGVAWARADITDPNSLRRLPDPFDSVVHLAGLLSSADPAAFYAVNFEGTRNLAEEAASRRLSGRFLFASSLSAAGPADGGPARTEGQPCRPVDDYGRSKLMAELWLASMTGRLSSTIVRLPLVYGPGSRGGLYSYFRQIKRRYFLDMGERRTTVGYIDDVVRGILAALDSPCASGQTYFLGEDPPYAAGEIVTAIQSAVGTRARGIKVPLRLGYCGVAVYEAACRMGGRKALVSRQDLRAYFRYADWSADTGKAAREIGYATAVPLAEGVRRTAAWYHERGML